MAGLDLGRLLHRSFAVQVAQLCKEIRVALSSLGIRYVYIL